MCCSSQELVYLMTTRKRPEPQHNKIYHTPPVPNPVNLNRCFFPSVLWAAVNVHVICFLIPHISSVAVKKQNKKTKKKQRAYHAKHTRASECRRTKTTITCFQISLAAFRDGAECGIILSSQSRLCGFI